MTSSGIIIKELVKDQDYFKQLAYRYTKNEQDALDLVQDTMCRVLQKLNYFTEGTNLKAWISVIMRNTFINDYRKKRKMRLVDLDKREVISVCGSEDSLAEYNLLDEELNTAILKLNSRNQEVINLIKRGYNYKEMAVILNLPIGTVKSRIHLARKALRKVLNKMNKES